MNIEQARFNMIEQQIRPWDVLDTRVLDILSATPRELFVHPKYINLAFADWEIPIGHSQSMMSPKLEGRMLQALQVDGNDTVLEIGTGSGYVTACLARLSRQVTSVEYFEAFTHTAADTLKQIGVINTQLHTGDAVNGWAGGPYDVIAITASLPEYNHCFEQLLSMNGRLFVVTGELPAMHAMLVTRVSENQFLRTRLFETHLAPMINAHKPQVFEL